MEYSIFVGFLTGRGCGAGFLWEFRSNGMTALMRVVRGARFAALFAATLAVAACSTNQNPADVNPNANANTPGSVQDFVVNVGDRVFFESDQSELTPQARATLDKQVQWLQQYGQYQFTVEGHADERGTREYNIALGARRAQTVRDYLASRGINPARMRTISYGKERPVAVCNDISCWSQNRRAVTVLNSAPGS
jgi:peptidoglycan-associated lipoprotein